MLLYVLYFFLSFVFASLQNLLGPQSTSYGAIGSLSCSDLPLIDFEGMCSIVMPFVLAQPLRSSSTQKDSMRLVSEADRFGAHFGPHCRHCLELLWSFNAIQVINGWHTQLHQSIKQQSRLLLLLFLLQSHVFFEQFCFKRQTLAVERVWVLQLRGHFDVAGWCQFSGLRGAFSSTSRYIVPKSLRSGLCSFNSFVCFFTFFLFVLFV